MHEVATAVDQLGVIVALSAVLISATYYMFND
jgi:hypothetical protein